MSKEILAIEKQLIECNKEFSAIVKRQQEALQAVSLLKLDEPAMLGHLRDAVYSFYRPYFDKNSVEQIAIERVLQAAQHTLHTDAAPAGTSGDNQTGQGLRR